MSIGASLTPFKYAEPRFGKDLIEIKNSSLVKVDLKYAGTDNFMQQDLYQGFNRAFLHLVAHDQFSQALKKLEKDYPDRQFVLYDVLRPRSVQKIMHAHVAHTQFADYVADPVRGSLHNFGMAIDLSWQGKLGTPIDMGTEFDDFTELAQPQLEEQLLSQGKLSQQQAQNRRDLRTLMESAGFQQLPHEWWHYNALPAEQVRKEFLIIE